MYIVLNIKNNMEGNAKECDICSSCYAAINALWLCLQSCGTYVASITMQEFVVLLLGKACDCKWCIFLLLSLLMLLDMRRI